MKRRFYLITRDLHLYLGLFVSPFVLVFSFSVFFLVHTWVPWARSGASTLATVEHVSIPADIAHLDGRARVDAIRQTLEQIGVKGEVENIRNVPKEQRLIVPVSVPGRETIVDFDLASRTAKIQQRETGIADALVLLHKSPGPHLTAIRMNWIYMAIWRWLADATAYLLLFLSLTGIYLWTLLKAERRTGLILLGAGVLSFFGIAYGLYL